MNQPVSTSLYNQVTAIAEDYLGPAAERFITRQIAFHLSKAPHELTPEDLPTLIEWSRVTLALLTEDQHLIDEYVSRVQKLVGDEK